MFPLLRTDPDRAAWIDQVAADIGALADRQPRRTGRGQPREPLPARDLRRARPPRLPRPDGPEAVGRPGRRRGGIRRHQRGDRPPRHGDRPGRDPGPALAAGLGHRRAEGALAARHRGRRPGVLRVDQREERRLVVQDHAGHRHPRRLGLDPRRPQDAREHGRRLRRHAVLRLRARGPDQLPGRHVPARRHHQGHRRDRLPAHPHRRRALRQRPRPRRRPARPGRRRHADLPVDLQREPSGQRIRAHRLRTPGPGAGAALRAAAPGGRQHGHRLPGHPVDGRRLLDGAARGVAGPRPRRARSTTRARTPRCTPRPPSSWPSPPRRARPGPPTA